MNDSDLVQLARLNSEEAKEELLDRCKDIISFHVMRYKNKYFGKLNRFDVEDLVSICHVAALESIELYDVNKGSGFSNFAKFRIRSKLIDYLRNSSVRARYIDLSADVYKIENKAMQYADPMERLNISKISDRDKQVIAMILDGETYSEVAKKFNISKPMVQKILKGCVK